MTPSTPTDQQPKEHCDHECVCSLYGVECWYGHHKSDKSEPCDMKGVLINPCQHDTRSRPHPAPAPESHCDKCDHWDICEGCPYTDERPTEKDSEYNKRVAAYISPADIDEIRDEAARQAREDTLIEVGKRIIEVMHYPKCNLAFKNGLDTALSIVATMRSENKQAQPQER